MYTYFPVVSELHNLSTEMSSYFHLIYLPRLSSAGKLQWQSTANQEGIASAWETSGMKQPCKQDFQKASPTTPAEVRRQF